MDARLLRPTWPPTVRQFQGPGPGIQQLPVPVGSHRPLVQSSGHRTPQPSSAVSVPGSVSVYPIFTPQRPTSVPSRTSSKQSASVTSVAPPSERREPVRLAREPPVEAPPREKAEMREPLLKTEKEVPKVTVDLELQDLPAEAEWWGWSWVRTLVLLLGGVVLWIYPQRWASVFLLLLALLLSPHLGLALRGGLALPHLKLRRLIASWLLDFGFGIGSAIQEQEKTWKPKLDQALAPESDFSQGVNRYALRIAGNLGQAVLQEKAQWMPAMVDAVGDIVPPALSRVMEKKEEWTPALTALVADIVPSVMRGVLSHHHSWSPALMQLVGDVVPPVLTSVLKNREWTPALLEFVGEVVPVIVAVVLRRPELPPAIAAFVDSAGPSLAPAVVRLIDYIIMDPKLMQTIRRMTDDSMRDEALVKNIKNVIESSLKEGTMYRAVGHGMLAAAGQSLEHMHQRTKEKLVSHQV